MERLLRLTGALLLLIIPVVVSSTPLWTDITTTRARSAVASGAVADSPYKAYRHVATDTARLRSVLNAAPMENSGEASATITLPMPDGSLREFVMQESPVMEPGLAQHIPEFNSYKVRAVDDATVTGRISIGARGFNGMIMTHEGTVFIDPVPKDQTDRYYSFYKHDYDSPLAGTFTCKVQKQDAMPESPLAEFRTLARTSNTIQEYKLAVATTGEYSQTVASGNQANTLNEVLNAINRVNQIYERDLAIRLNLVADNIDIVYTNSSTDPYPSADATLILDENQTAIDTAIGSANYDIGHVFSTAGGGLAGFGVVCDDARKARAGSGMSSPTGDPFYIDLVAHEIGHQFAADHSFNGTSSSCGGNNRNPGTAFEPGSGSTIMAYAGICGSENVQANSDATFHAGSIEQIVNFSRNVMTGGFCASASATGAAPDANAGPDYIIPRYSPFTLTGSASDIDTPAGSLSYQWDQMDSGTATTGSTYGEDLCSNALFRSFPPGSSAVRDFPDIETIRFGSTDPAQTIPTQARFLNFRLTARDGNGGVDEDDMRISVVNNSDAFAVLQPNTLVTLDYDELQVIEWNSACTEQAPVNCANVDILLSTDGGMTYPTVLLAGTPNNGSATVSLPASIETAARIKIRCSDNIFFDISDTDFQIANTGFALTSTGNGGSIGCSPGSLPTSCTVSSGIDQEPNDTPSQATPVTLPVSGNGRVNDSTDAFDYYVFTVAAAGNYTFVLSNYGSNDLDLMLFDSTGTNLIQQSISEANPSESFIVALTAGQTYYVAVNAWVTSGLDTGYLLTINATPGGDGGGVLNIWFLMGLLTVIYARSTFHRRS